MTQIKYVTAALPKTSENSRNFLLNDRRICTQNRWIHIALQGYFVAYSLSRARYVHGPIKAEAVTTSVGHRFKPEPTALGKKDHWNIATVVMTNQPSDNFLHIGERKLLIRRVAECATPKYQKFAPPVRRQ